MSKETKKALRARKRRERAARMAKAHAAHKPRRGPQPLAVVKIDALASPEQAKGYPDFPKLVREWGPRMIARFRHRATASATVYVFKSAEQSLPQRPTELEFRAWMVALHRGETGRKLAPGTINRFRETLNTLYEHARIRGGPWHNPLADVEPLKDDAPRVLPLNDKNVRAYFERAMSLLDDPRDRGLLAVARYTGMRIGEALALKAEDIDKTDPAGPRLHIIRQRKPGSYESGQLKHIRQRRFVPLHPDLYTRLLEVLRLGPAQVIVGSVVRGPAVVREPCPYLFPHRGKALKKLAKKLKAMLPEGEWPEGQAFHVFRHAWAIEAYRKARMPLPEISLWLGHSSIGVTEAYLRELMGYDSPVTALERLWAAQSGGPMPVEQTDFANATKEGFDAGTATGGTRGSTKLHPTNVIRPKFKPSSSDREP